MNAEFERYLEIVGMVTGVLFILGVPVAASCCMLLGHGWLRFALGIPAVILGLALTVYAVEKKL